LAIYHGGRVGVVVTVLDSNKLLKKENSELFDSIKNYEKRINSLHKLDTKHPQELTNVKTEIDQLRIASERNPERVYIQASCKKPKAPPPTAWMMQSSPDLLTPLFEIIGYSESELQNQSK